MILFEFILPITDVRIMVEDIRPAGGMVVGFTTKGNKIMLDWATDLRLCYTTALVTYVS